MTVFRTLKNTTAHFRKLTKAERGKMGRAHKYYNLADVLVTLRWASPKKIKPAEQELIEIDYKNRMIGLKNNG